MRWDCGPWPDRFWANVEKTPTCWLWTGRLDRYGYGLASVPVVKTRKAHRVAYELLVGPIPEDKEIHHECRVRRCVSPEHLRAVTHQENLALAVRVRKETCPYGHPYAETAYTWGGRTWCRICRTARARRRRQAKRADAR